MLTKFLPILLALPLLASNEPSLNATQKQEVKDLVAQTLKENPKLIVDSLVEIRKQQMAEYQKQAEKNIAKYSDDIYDKNVDLVLGNPKAKITIVEFMDYNCGHCKSLAKTLENMTKNNRDLKVIIKDLPYFGESSMTAAKAAYAANQQYNFEKFHYAILEQKQQANEENMLTLAKKLGLNLTKYKKDFASKEAENYIQNNVELAKNLEIYATPAMIVGKKTANVFVAGAIPAEKLAEIISSVQ